MLHLSLWACSSDELYGVTVHGDWCRTGLSAGTDSRWGKQRLRRVSTDRKRVLRELSGKALEVFGRAQKDKLLDMDCSNPGRCGSTFLDYEAIFECPFFPATE